MAYYKTILKWIWPITYLLSVIGIAIGTRRLLIIGDIISGTSKSGPDFDSAFHIPDPVTIIHVIPGLIFMLAGPLQFVERIRHKYLRFHRYSGWAFIVAAYIIGVSALSMPFIAMPIGGISEATGSVFFAIFFLVAITKALGHILRRRINLHREWMLRAFATGLAIATVRPIMALAFVIFKVTPHEFLGTAFWMGFTVHLIAAEIWINYTRRSAPIVTREIHSRQASSSRV